MAHVNTSHSFTALGKLTVVSQRLIVAIYYLLLGTCLYFVDWQYASWLSILITAYIGLWVADFASGLVHLYIDYQPLNYAKGFGVLYDYKGDRGGEHFVSMKKELMKHASWFDHTVYSFKIHHRDASSNKHRHYREFFVEFVAPASILLFCSLFVSFVFPQHFLTTHLALFDVIVSVAALHADHIHVCMHGSSTMLRGKHIVRFLSRYRVIYSYKTHALHHKDGLTGFCFVTGHANFAVNWICKQLLYYGVISSDDWFGRSEKA